MGHDVGDRLAVHGQNDPLTGSDCIDVLRGRGRSPCAGRRALLAADP